MLKGCLSPTAFSSSNHAVLCIRLSYHHRLPSIIAYFILNIKSYTYLNITEFWIVVIMKSRIIFFIEKPPGEKDNPFAGRLLYIPALLWKAYYFIFLRTFAGWPLPPRALRCPVDLNCRRRCLLSDPRRLPTAHCQMPNLIPVPYR